MATLLLRKYFFFSSFSFTVIFLNHSNKLPCFSCTPYKLQFSLCCLSICPNPYTWYCLFSLQLYNIFHKKYVSYFQRGSSAHVNCIFFLSNPTFPLLVHKKANDFCCINFTSCNFLLPLTTSRSFCLVGFSLLFVIF